MEWFKFFGNEYLSDPKMLSLDPVEKALWLTMLCLASRDNGHIRHASGRAIMIMTGVDYSDDWRDYRTFLKKFQELEMIKVSFMKAEKNDQMITEKDEKNRQMITEKNDFFQDSVSIDIINFRKRQGSALSNYERLKRWRARQNEKNTNAGNDDNDVETRHDSINDNDRVDKNRVDIDKNNIRGIPSPQNNTMITKKPIKQIRPQATLSILDDPDTVAALKKQFPIKDVDQEIQKAKDWMLSKGRVFKDYVAFMRNWLRHDYGDSKGTGRHANIDDLI